MQPPLDSAYWKRQLGQAGGREERRSGRQDVNDGKGEEGSQREDRGRCQNMLNYEVKFFFLYCTVCVDYLFTQLMCCIPLTHVKKSHSRQVSLIGSYCGLNKCQELTIHLDTTTWTPPAQPHHIRSLWRGQDGKPAGVDGYYGHWTI